MNELQKDFSTTPTSSLPRSLFAAGLLLALGACGSEPPALMVGDVTYQEEELPGFRADRKARLAEIAAFGLAVARGQAEELGAPVSRRTMDEALVDLLERDLRLGFAGVGEDLLRARYRENPRYELTVRHLVILVEPWADEEEARAARDRARSALERIRDGEPFPRVAGEVSEEPGAGERGGLLAPGRAGSWVDEFWAAASSLEVGEVSPVVRTPYGFHVLRLEDRTVVPFEEARHWAIDRVARDVPPLTAELQRWGDSVTAPLEVESAVLLQGLEEAGTVLALLNRGFPSDRPDSTVAWWPEGAFTAGELRAFLLAGDSESWADLESHGREALPDAARRGAELALLVGIAHERGLRVTPEMEASIRREWETLVTQLAASLGFREGMTPDQVATQALAALGASGQGAEIARQSLHRWSALLRSAYPRGPEAFQAVE